MPKGKPNAQTIATAKYQQKAGYITKGFKLKKELADEFTEACKKAGVPQATKIAEYMRAFIEEQKNK